MGKGGLDDIDYKNGQKNNWRSTVWNDLTKKIGRQYAGGQGAEDIVLYLPAANDLDRKIAVSKGVLPHNLIAVERNLKVVRKLRASGTNVIHGDVFDVLAAWPHTTEKRVRALVLDLQCNLTWPVVQFMARYLGCPFFTDTVLVVNLQRGRETKEYASWVRAVAHDLKHNLQENRNVEVETGEAVVYSVDDKTTMQKHRGVIAFNCAIRQLAGWVGDALGLQMLDAHAKCLEHLSDARVMHKWFRSYRSSPRSPLFDSLVLWKLDDGSVNMSVTRDGSAEAHAKIRAALAVRTMKISRKLH